MRPQNYRKQNYERTGMMENKDNRFRKRYFIAFTIMAIIGAIIYMTPSKQYVSHFIPIQTPQTTVHREQPEEDEITSEKIVVGSDKDLSKMLEIEDKMKNGEKVENPDTVMYRGIEYYLFDGDILTPVNTKEWYQMNITEGENKITEFYLSEETPKNWTEKITIHQVTNHDNCFEISDKLINGIIANIESSVKSQGKELTKDNLLFNFVKKDANDTVFFWHVSNLVDMDDEVQFTRCFIAPYSGKMYLVTYSLKAPITAIDNNHIAMYIQNVNSAMELKRKDG